MFIGTVGYVRFPAGRFILVTLDSGKKTSKCKYTWSNNDELQRVTQTVSFSGSPLKSMPNTGVYFSILKAYRIAERARFFSR